MGTHLVVRAKAAGVPVAVAFLDAICTAACRWCLQASRQAAQWSALQVRAAHPALRQALQHVPVCHAAKRAQQNPGPERTRAATSAAVGVLAGNTAGGLK